MNKEHGLYHIIILNADGRTFLGIYTLHYGLRTLDSDVLHVVSEFLQTDTLYFQLNSMFSFQNSCTDR